MAIRKFNRMVYALVSALVCVMCTPAPAQVSLPGTVSL